MRLAGHLADYALEAAPEDVAVRGRCGHLSETGRPRDEPIAENLFHAAAAAVRQASPAD